MKTCWLSQQSRNVELTDWELRISGISVIISVLKNLMAKIWVHWLGMSCKISLGLVRHALNLMVSISRQVDLVLRAGVQMSLRMLSTHSNSSDFSRIVAILSLRMEVMQIKVLWGDHHLLSAGKIDWADCLVAIRGRVEQMWCRYLIRYHQPRTCTLRYRRNRTIFANLADTRTKISKCGGISLFLILLKWMWLVIRTIEVGNKLILVLKVCNWKLFRNNWGWVCPHLCRKLVQRCMVDKLFVTCSKHCLCWRSRSGFQKCAIRFD